MSPLLSAENLNVWYHNTYALKNVSLTIPEKRITALIGASGSGKSTFLRSLNRMLDVVPNTKTEGSILYRGENILGNNIDVIALRRKVGMVFQNPTPFPKTIFENVSYGLEIQGVRKKKKGLLERFWGRGKSPNIDIEESVHELDRSVVQSLKEAALWEEVKDRLHLSAFRLSGGQQQRLCIARCLAVRPEILLLDEPCSQLDPISTSKIEKLLLQLKEQYTIVIVTHNLQQAKRIADYVGVFHLGEMTEYGESKQIFEQPRTQLARDYVSGNFG